MNNGMLSPPQREPSDVEVAWFAGLYEGEGTCRAHRSLHTGSRAGGATLNIRMTDRDVIERCGAIMGGSVLDMPCNKAELAKGYKPKFRWAVHSWRDVQRVVDLIYPYLGTRRRSQIDQMMRWIPEHPRGTRACPAEIVPNSVGYKRHRRLGEPPCDTCRKSHSLACRLRTLKRNPDAEVRPEHAGRHLGQRKGHGVGSTI